MDDATEKNATPKRRKPLTDAERFSNLTKALAEDALTENAPENGEPWAGKTKRKRAAKKTRDGL
jgi:hypothetical protein